MTTTLIGARRVASTPDVRLAVSGPRPPRGVCLSGRSGIVDEVAIARVMAGEFPTPRMSMTEIRIAAARMAERGYSAATIGRAVGIHPDVVGRWNRARHAPGGGAR